MKKLNKEERTLFLTYEDSYRVRVVLSNKRLAKFFPKMKALVEEIEKDTGRKRDRFGMVHLSEAETTKWEPRFVELMEKAAKKAGVNPYTAPREWL